MHSASTRYLLVTLLPDRAVFTIALHPNPEVAKAVTRELGLMYSVFEGHGSDLEKQKV